MNSFIEGQWRSLVLLLLVPVSLNCDIAMGMDSKNFPMVNSKKLSNYTFGEISQNLNNNQITFKENNLNSESNIITESNGARYLSSEKYKSLEMNFKFSELSKLRIDGKKVSKQEWDSALLKYGQKLPYDNKCYTTFEALTTIQRLKKQIIENKKLSNLEQQRDFIGKCLKNGVYAPCTIVFNNVDAFKEWVRHVNSNKNESMSNAAKTINLWRELGINVSLYDSHDINSVFNLIDYYTQMLFGRVQEKALIKANTIESFVEAQISEALVELKNNRNFESVRDRIKNSDFIKFVLLCESLNPQPKEYINIKQFLGWVNTFGRMNFLNDNVLQKLQASCSAIIKNSSEFFGFENGLSIKSDFGSEFLKLFIKLTNDVTNGKNVESSKLQLEFLNTLLKNDSRNEVQKLKKLVFEACSSLNSEDIETTSINNEKQNITFGQIKSKNITISEKDNNNKNIKIKKNSIKEENLNNPRNKIIIQDGHQFSSNNQNNGLSMGSNRIYNNENSFPTPLPEQNIENINKKSININNKNIKNSLSLNPNYTVNNNNLPFQQSQQKYNTFDNQDTISFNNDNKSIIKSKKSIRDTAIINNVINSNKFIDNLISENENDNDKKFSNIKISSQENKNNINFDNKNEFIKQNEKEGNNILSSFNGVTNENLNHNNISIKETKNSQINNNSNNGFNDNINDSEIRNLNLTKSSLIQSVNNIDSIREFTSNENVNLNIRAISGLLLHTNTTVENFSDYEIDNKDFFLALITDILTLGSAINADDIENVKLECEDGVKVTFSGGENYDLLLSALVQVVGKDSIEQYIKSEESNNKDIAAFWKEIISQI